MALTERYKHRCLRYFSEPGIADVRARLLLDNCVAKYSRRELNVAWTEDRASGS